MTKHLKFLLILSIAACSCNEPKKQSIFVEYANDKNNCDPTGFPLDSSSTYFPRFLFKDTVDAIITDNNNDLLYDLSKEEYAKEHNLELSQLKDTFEITHESFVLEYLSYALFKMDEPILFDHYLHKDVYRMIGFRSLNSPLIVRIEKNKKGIDLIVKRLNKNIRYPFMVYTNLFDSVFYTTPDVAYYDTALHKMIVLDSIKYSEQYGENKRFQDSIMKRENVIDYYLAVDTIIKAPPSFWNMLQTMIDSTEFWIKPPNSANGYPQIDGSRWILEGHTKKGYQFKLIPSPNFDNSPYKNYFDKNDLYVHIFNFLLDSAHLNVSRY